MGRPFDDVLLDLVQAIVGSHFPEGGRFPSEQALSTQFGAGRGVLRDALLALELRGLVYVEPGRGRRVRQREQWDLRDPVVLWACLERGPDPGTLAQIVAARATIEAAAAAHAAEHAADSDIDQLAARVEAMQRALEPAAARSFDGRDPLVRAEMQFHAQLAAMADNPVLAMFVAPLHEPLAQWRHRHAADRDRAVVHHHRRILEGLSAREPALAEAAILGYAHQLTRWLPARR